MNTNFLTFGSNEDRDPSVYSPSAYFVDLLQLLEDKLSDYSKVLLEEKRTDIQGIVLSKENTYDIEPYLNIVNNILKNSLSNNPDVQEILKEIKYPFNLPFNFDNERLKKIIKYLDITLEELYKLFAINNNSNSNIIAREYLQLSWQEYSLLTEDIKDEELEQYWGIDIANKDPIYVIDFLKYAQISGVELLEILYQNLSKEEETLLLSVL